MNGEIKFRAWDGEKMILPDAVEYLIEFDGTVWKNNGNSHQDVLNQLDGIMLMQFTGIKDKNGKEIYEGDIVGYNFWTSDVETETGIAPVVFVDAAFMIDEWYLHIAETEIIGNIYENPELLKPSKTETI